MKTKNSMSTILYIILASAMILTSAGIINGKDKADNSKKKLYIAAINSEGVSDKITRQIKEGVRLSIFENYGTVYQVLDDESVKIMYKQAEKIMSSGCDDTSCMQQIADGINADEVIYGTVESDSGRIKLTLTNLERKGVELSPKSIVNITCSENELDHYSREIAKKLIDPGYALKKPDTISSSEISLKVIDTTKIEGLDISVLKFKSSDDTITQVIEKLKVIVEKGDGYFKDNDYESAREEYDTVIKRIETKVPPAKQTQLEDYVKRIYERIASSHVMEIKRKIEKIDKKVEKEKSASFDDLQDFYNVYLEMEKQINNVPKKYSGGLDQVRNALNSRTDSIVVAMIFYIEKEGDVYYKDYKDYRFDLALASYQKARELCVKINSAELKSEQMNRLDKKDATTRETGESYITSMVKNYYSRALVFNVDDATSAAKSSMKDAYKLLTGNMHDFVTEEAVNAYNEMAGQLGMDLLSKDNFHKAANKKTENKIAETVQGETFKNYNWAGENTFRLVAVGTPKNGLKNTTQRRESAKRAAIGDAQYQITEKWGLGESPSSGSEVVFNELKKVVKSGQILSAAFDDFDNCEIIYEVKTDNLKNKVKSLQSGR